MSVWRGVALMSWVHGVLLAVLLLPLAARGVGCGGFVRFPEGSVSPAELASVTAELVTLETDGSVLVRAASKLDPNAYFFFAEDAGDYAVRVRGPPGWTFEPQSIAVVIGTSTPCTADFSFAGLAHRGRVEVQGCTEGPAGLTVRVGSVETTTDASGTFSAGPLLPGSYAVLVRGAATAVAHVGFHDTPTVVQLPGYRVYGHLGAPDVTLRLSATHQTVSSGPQGVFELTDVPCGDYTLSASHAMWHVEPSTLTLRVSNSDVDLSGKFRVSKFLARGVVTGVAGARVSLSDGQTVTTADDGSYALVLEADQSYTLTVTRQGYVFDGPLPLKPPHSQALPAVAPVALQLCYRCSAGAVTVRLNGTVVTGAQGCFTVTPASTYVLEPLNSSSAVYRTHTINVEHVPPPTVVLEPLLARVTGAVVCTVPEECPALVKVQLESADGGSIVEGRRQVGPDGSFEFASVVPALYRVQVAHDGRWCWGDAGDARPVDARTTLAPPRVVIAQTGYRVRIDNTLKLPLEITISGSGTQPIVEKIDASPKSLCLAAPGVHEITVTGAPSCLRIPVVRYDTAQPPSPVIIRPSAFRISGRVRLAPGSDAHDALRAVTVAVTGDKDHRATVLVDAQGGYEHWVPTLGRYTVAPSSPSLLFEPASAVAVVDHVDACAGAVPAFEAVSGIFVAGSTTPPTPDLEVRIVRGDATEPVAVVRTGADGRYRHGPLAPARDYRVQATHATLAVTYQDVFDMLLAPHAALQVAITDAEGHPLGDVLVSISSPSVQQSASSSAADGAVLFDRLPQDAYHVRPVDKEFTFEPTHQSVHVRSRERVVFVATRTAFSGFGTVVGLNKAPEKALSVVATPISGEKNALVTEARTDDRGAFRLRGLLPGQRYRVRVKPADRLERTSPAELMLTVDGAEVHNLVFVAFRRLGLGLKWIFLFSLTQFFLLSLSLSVAAPRWMWPAPFVFCLMACTHPSLRRPWKWHWYPSTQVLWSPPRTSRSSSIFPTCPYLATIQCVFRAHILTVPTCLRPRKRLFPNWAISCAASTPAASSSN